MNPSPRDNLAPPQPTFAPSGEPPSQSVRPVDPCPRTCAAVDRLVESGWRCCSKVEEQIPGLGEALVALEGSAATGLPLTPTSPSPQGPTQSGASSSRSAVKGAILSKISGLSSSLSTPSSMGDRLQAGDGSRSGDSIDLGAFAALSEAEDDALFALSNSGYDPARVAGGLRNGAQRLSSTLALLELDGEARAYIASGKPSRIARTLLAIEDLTTAQQRRMRLDPVRPSQVGSRGRGWSAADVGGVAVAAVLMLGISVPVFSSVREKGQITACASNMRSVGLGMAQYARDYNGFMPMASAGFGGSLVVSPTTNGFGATPVGGGGARASEPQRSASSDRGDPCCWWNVGKKGQSNSANLFLLACEKYVPINAMACSGESHCLVQLCPSSTDYSCASEVAYSMQVQRPGGMQLEGPRRVVLSDRNPLTLRSMRGEMLDAMENSANHRGRGQQILDNSGGVAWTCKPKDPVSGDNIWIPADMESELVSSGRRWLKPLKGDEQSRSVIDVLVGP